MSKAFVHITCYLIIVLTTCIDKGNGSWKKKSRENLQKEIAKFEQMAENIEDEIEDFYDEYSKEWPKDPYYSNEDEEPHYFDSRKTNEVNINKNEVGPDSVPILNDTKTLTKNLLSPAFEPTFSKTANTKVDTLKEISSTEKTNTVNKRWPKFNDILLDMGKKYDWKNDRWIKVKKKPNQTIEDNHLNFHERHKFSYRTVKVNRGKSRRNVVIAVTAIR